MFGIRGLAKSGPALLPLVVERSKGSYLGFDVLLLRVKQDRTPNVFLQRRIRVGTVCRFTAQHSASGLVGKFLSTTCGHATKRVALVCLANRLP